MNEQSDNSSYSMSDEELESELELLGLSGFFEGGNSAETTAQESREIITELYQTLHNITPTFVET